MRAAARKGGLIVAQIALVLASAAPAQAFSPWDAPPTLTPQWLGRSEARRAPLPKRIVTLAPSATEFVFALGAGDRLIGVSRYDDYPPEARKLPHLGGFTDLNLEGILAAKPDLVIAVANAGNRSSLERLAKLGVVVLVVPGNSFADTFHAGRAIAAALGGPAPARGEAILASIRRRVVAVHKRTTTATTARVAFVIDHNPLVLAGPGSFPHTLLEIVGARNVVTVQVPYPPYSTERLIADAPDIMLDVAAEHVGPAKREDWNRWTVIPAVKNDRVYTFDATALLRAGPRIAAGLEQIAALIHPPG